MRKQLIFIALALSLYACSHKSESRKTLDFLYDNMSLADSLCYSEDFWRSNVEKTLEVREKMHWNVPEREFLNFVLPLRVNNETLDSFRLVYADSLCGRVKGMTMYDAVLEINHWCHEMATYSPSDARTSSPMATISKGLGRCGEESVLGVAALRAVGIPSRQVYTPRWAHTDDNHAWIEAWVDGRWHFLGACEPEPRLDIAWFNAPVSRALLLHTNALGSYDGEEDVITRNPVYSKINVTDNYVPVRNAVVKVIDENGKALEGITVEYKIYNYAEFYTVAKYKTSAEGIVAIHIGLGNMLAWAYGADGRFALERIGSDTTTVKLDRRFGERFSIDFDIVPPVENPIPSDATEEESSACKLRFERENVIRDARPKQKGKVVEAFLADNPDNSVAQELCNSLSEKDMNDVTRDVLEDALAHVKGEFDPCRDCPRIELEFLRPFFEELSSGPVFETPKQIVGWVKAEITVDVKGNPQNLRIPPAVVWRSRVSDRISRNIFFVAMCRAAGFRARIEAVTGKTQYHDGNDWMDVDFDGQNVQTKPSEKGFLNIRLSESSSVPDPLYYRHFTLSRIVDGRTELLSFDESGDQPFSSLFRTPMSVDAGWYCLTSGLRMADGTVLSHIEFFNVESGKTTNVPLEVRNSSETLSVAGSINAGPFLSRTGRGCFLMAVLGDNDEPSVHAVNQLSSMADKLNSWGRCCLIYGKKRNLGLTNAVFDEKEGSRIQKMLCDGCGCPIRSLPAIAVCDSFGQVFYLSQGYNTSLVQDLDRIIGQL